MRKKIVSFIEGIRVGRNKYIIKFRLRFRGFNDIIQKIKDRILFK